MLISHTHWDHIQGIPFFAPFFGAGNVWDIYGPKGLSQSLQATLAGQMEHTYFPVTLDEFAAKLRYHDLVEGAFGIGAVGVITRYLNHPALTLGFRIEADGATVAYCCDHEPHAPALASGEAALTGMDRRYADFVAGADLVIHDTQYTASEYPAKIGWGHSPVEYAVRVCRDAGVKRLALTHYDPLRDDAAVDGILEEIQRRYLAFNGHSASYTWKRTDSSHVARILNMRETLDANGIPDESLQFDALSIDEDDFIPIVHLYFSDDLTVA